MSTPLLKSHLKKCCSGDSRGGCFQSDHSIKRSGVRVIRVSSEKNKMASSLDIDLARMATARRTFMIGVAALDEAWTRG